MRQCKICEKPIQRRIRVNEMPILLTSGRMTCHQCKPHKGGDSGNSRDTTRIDNQHGQTFRQCKHCDKWLGHDHYYRKTGFQCKACVLRSRRTKTSTKAKLKLLAVQYKGGKCLDCDGVFPICTYDFHHRNSKQKDFMISSKGCSWNQDIQNELDKCDLLCANCHRIRHAKNQDYLQYP